MGRDEMLDKLRAKRNLRSYEVTALQTGAYPANVEMTYRVAAANKEEAERRVRAKFPTVHTILHVIET